MASRPEASTNDTFRPRPFGVGVASDAMFV